MKTITIVLSTTNGWASGFIRWAQRCPYSHVEVEFDGYTIGARSSGVNKYTEADNHNMIVLHRRTVEVTDEQYDKFVEFIESKLGDGYDFRAYLGFVIFKKTHSERRWFCSELLVDAFEQADIRVLDHAQSWFSTPRDFMITPALTDAGVEYIQ